MATLTFSVSEDLHCAAACSRVDLVKLVLLN